MKIRNGFVSNSSSSSFLIAFPSKPQSEQDLIDWMFDGDGEGMVVGYTTLSKADAAERVFADISEQKRTVLPMEIVGLFSSRYYSASNSYNIENKETYYAVDCPQLVKEFVDLNMEKENIYNERIKAMEAAGVKFDEWFQNTNGYLPVSKKYDSLIKETVDEEEKTKLFEEKNDWVTYLKERQIYVYKKEKEYQKSFEGQTDSLYSKMGDITMRIAMNDALKFLQDNQGKFIVELNYGDDSGDAVLEHGGIFENLPHVQVSMH